MEVYASVDYYFKGFLLRKATGVNPITLTTPDADFFCILWFTGVNRPPVVVGMGAGSKCGLVWRDPPVPPSLPSLPLPLEVGPYPPFPSPALPSPPLPSLPPVLSLPLPLEVGPLKSS